jgi:ketosteroid isomerase-like protein
MRRLTWVLFLFLIFGVAPAVWAGPAEEAAQMAEQWMKAFHEGNVEALSALYAPDAMYYSSLSPFRVEGREAIRTLFAGVFRAFPTRS